MKWLISGLKTLGLGILALVVLSVMTVGILRAVWGHRLAAEMEAIKARGEPLSVADIPQPKIPDSQNAAPIYKQAFKELPESSNSESDLIKAFEETDSASLARAAELLTPYQRSIALAVRASSMSGCVFPLAKQDKYADRPETRLRRLSRLLGCSARLKAGQGDADGAVRFIEAQLRMADCSGTEGRWVTFAQKSSMLSIASGTLRDCGSRITINQAQARELYNAFGAADLKAAYVRGVQGERAHFLDASAKSPVAVWDRAAQLHFLGGQISSADLTYKEYEARGLTRKMPFYARAARMRAGQMTGIFTIHTRSRSRLAGSRIFLALLAHHDRCGSYPRTLDELRSKLGWPLEKDPFTGDDFVYRRESKGFILYGLDQDLRDDGDVTHIENSYSRNVVWAKGE